MGLVNGRVIRDSGAGVVTLSADGVLIVKRKVGAVEKYVLRGWLDGPAMTVMKINGPWYGDIPAGVLADPDVSWNLDQYWTRMAKVK